MTHEGGWTRGGLLRTAAAGGVAAAAGAAIGARDSSRAAPSQETDVKILNLVLLLEHAQEDLYRQAVESGRLSGDLLAYASRAGQQEGEHVKFLSERLGSRARSRSRSDFREALSSPEKFRDTAIMLEEAAIATYIGQAANLTRDALAEVATLISVEARQVAWVRDLAGISPAPKAADPARKPDDVLADLRKRGFIA